MQRVDKMTSPPIVGDFYLVPCLQVLNQWTGMHYWHPVLLPNHEDAKYGAPQWHYHGDGRFLDQYKHLPAGFRTQTLTDEFLVLMGGVVSRPGEDVVEYQEMECLRDIPIIHANLFGEDFKSDFRGSKIKCNTCPHRRAYLGNIPVIDGKIHCPMHGLPFDATTRKCLI